MHDIWNPWHGCKKISEGCENCYMYFLDAQRDKSGADIYRVKNNFDYPLHRDRAGNYKIKSGEYIRVCMTSDFFLAEADEWREEAWSIIKKRPDVIFILVTKRPGRVLEHLPADWGDGWENVWFHATTENQKRADERLPILLDLPFKHKGVMVAPFIGKVSLRRYLQSGQIENVWCGGENYSGARPLFYEWVEALSFECKEYDVTFEFFETGNVFIKNNRKISNGDKIDQTKLAYLSGLNYESTKKQVFKLPKIVEHKQINLFSSANPAEKYYKDHCKYCAMKKRCVGCTNCGKCKM